jgi:hypothetical protein
MMTLCLKRMVFFPPQPFIQVYLLTEQENMQMEKPKQPNTRRVPQLKIRTSLTAGGSLENCQQNLSYWQKRYAQMCRLR